MRIRLAVFLLALMVSAFAVSAQTETPENSFIAQFDLPRIQRATVLVMQTRTVDGITQITCVSSGTIVTPDGLILTNAHGTLTNPNCPGDSIIIGLSVREGEPPVPSFRAVVAQSDPGLDLALLRINAELNGQPIQSNELTLPFVGVANSDSITLDETIYVVGYPGIGDDIVTTVQATVQGFNSEPRGGERAWFKFVGITGGRDITGSMSGGGAYNRDGLLVGIPTTAPLARTIDTANCVQIQDTNGDGLINNSDGCVPLGGAINALRPVNFAQPLLQSAQLNLIITRTESTQPVSSLPPRISNLFFAPSVINGMPTTVLSSLPSGSSSIYLFFDYENMTPQTVYELRVSVNGSTNAIFSLPPVRWSGGASGLWYIGLTGQPLPNGELSFSLLVDGQLASDPRVIQVGGVAQEQPAFRTIDFLLTEGEERIFGNGYILGVGNTVTAQFTYINMTDGMEWAGVWYYNGTAVTQPFGGAWNRGANGATTTSLSVPGGLLPGRYRLELYIQGGLSGLAEFTIAGTREDIRPRVFTNARFTVANNDQAALTSGSVSEVTTTIQSLYAVFDWESLAPGTIWQIRWSVDNLVFFDTIAPWTLSENGTGYMTRLFSPGGIPDGNYRVDLLMNGILLQSVSAEVGIGQLPLNIFRESEGVLLRGRVIDANTRLGIPDVTIFILNEQFSVVDFQARQNQLYASTVTDRLGNYQFSSLLLYGIPYSLIITADGYLPITVDGIGVDNETDNPLERDIYLTKG